MAAAPASTMLSTISFGPGRGPGHEYPRQIGQGGGQFGLHGFDELVGAGPMAPRPSGDQPGTRPSDRTTRSCSAVTMRPSSPGPRSAP